MLNFADKLTLPLEAVTQTFAFLGKRGGGKTYGAMKLCELMLENSAQVIALDVVGVWYGLRVPKNDSDKAFNIPVFGGLNGDIEINPKSGRFIAEIIIERNLSAVVDISQFIHSEQTRFAYDFLTTLFERKKSNPSAVHVFLEESQEIVPQNVVKTAGDNYAGRMLHAGERLVKLGRNFGIGCSLISQRPQEVNKKVLNQTEVMLAFQMTGLQERKTIAEWVADKGEKAEHVQMLPKLAVGESYIWSPSWLKIAGIFKINEKRTADVSATPEVGTIQKTNKTLAPVDFEEISEAILSLTQEIEAENPASLKKQIAELKRQLAARPKEIPAPIKGIIAHPGALSSEQIKEIKKLVEDFHNHLWFINDAVEGITGLINQIKTILPTESQIEDAQKKGSYSLQVTPTSKPVKAVNAKPVAKSSLPSADLPKGEKIILIAIAQHTDGVTRDQLTILTGYKRSSRDAYIQRLSQRGFISVGSQILATRDGIDALGTDYEPLPTGSDLRVYWFNRLSGGEQVLFDLICRAYPESISRDELSMSSEYKRSSRDAYLQRLTARKLIRTVGRGEVEANPNLFD